MIQRCVLTACTVAFALLALTNLCAAEPAATDPDQSVTELTVTLEPNNPEPREEPVAATGNILPRIAGAVVDLATQFLGTPYRWGGTTPKAFDCSGFVRYCYKKMGVKLPRTAREQFKVGLKVAGKALRAGDLVFFDMMKGYVSHVGMYIGGGQFIHAANPRKGVRIDRISSPAYKKHLVGARRYTS